MHMYHHLISSEISKSCFEFYVVALKVVGTDIVVRIKSKKFSWVILDLKGNSVFHYLFNNKGFFFTFDTATKLIVNLY